VVPIDVQVPSLLGWLSVEMSGSFAKLGRLGPVLAIVVPIGAGVHIHCLLPYSNC